MGNIFNNFELLDFINLDEMMWEGGTFSGVRIPAAHLEIAAHAPSCSPVVCAIPKANLNLNGHNPSNKIVYNITVTGHLQITTHAPVVKASQRGIYFRDDTTPSSSTLDTMSSLVDGTYRTRAYGDVGAGIHDSAGIDFGQESTFDSITVHLATYEYDTLPLSGWYNSSHDDIAVYKSNDNATWELVTVITAPPFHLDDTYFFHTVLTLPQKVTARYVKVRPNGSDGLATASANPGSGAYSFFCGIEIDAETANIVRPPLAQLHLTAYVPLCYPVNKRYWVGPDTPYILSWSDTDNWSLTSGGASGASYPHLFNDLAIFDPNSHLTGTNEIRLIIEVDVSCNISGFPSGNKLNLSVSSHTMTLQDNLIGIYGFGTSAGGVLNLNGYNVSVTDEFIWVAGIINLGASTIEVGICNPSIKCTFFDMMAAYSGGIPTINSSGATIKVKCSRDDNDYNNHFGVGYGTLSNAQVFLYPNGHNIKFGMGGSYNHLSITGNGSVNGVLGAPYVPYDRQNDYTYSYFSVESCLTIEGSTSTGLTIDDVGVFSMSAGACVAKNCTIANCVATGGATFTATPANGNVNGGNNEGWYFIPTAYIPAGHLTIRGYAPSYIVPMVQMAHGSLQIAARAPSCVFPVASIGTAHLTLTAYAPQIIAGQASFIPKTTLTLTGYVPDFGITISAIPPAHLVLTGLVPQILESSISIPAASIIVSGYAPLCITDAVIPTAQLIINAYSPDFGPAGLSISLAAMRLTGHNPAYTWQPSEYHRFTLQNIYLCILTGDADGLADLVIPISSFQSTMRDGDPSYLACVLPNSVDYIDAIIARTNGDIVIRKGYRFSDGSAQTEEICRANYESLQIFRGARNDSATISGHKTTSSSDPKIVTLNKTSYYGLQVDGKRTFRAHPDLFLRVGDMAVYGNNAIVVGQIAYQVDTRQAIMQVTEA